MLERLLGPLPIWTRRDHPLLRYQLRTNVSRRRMRMWLRLLLGLLAGVVLLGFGYLVATNFASAPLPPMLTTETVNRVLYAPVFCLQLILGAAALSMTIGVVGESERRQQWDTLRVTESGAGLALRTRWVAVFFNLRPLLTVITVARLFLIVGVLWDLMAFQGEYLDLLISGISPQMSIPLPIGEPPIDLGLLAAILLLAFMLTAGIVLPFISVAFDAALGLLISTYVKQRTYTAILQIVLIVLRLAVTAALTYAALNYVSDQLVLSDESAWLVMAGFGAVADWGLYFLHLGSFGEVWARVPWGIVLGLVLMVFGLLQAFLAERMLVWATQRAQFRD
jgi:hypothetical protein